MRPTSARLGGDEFALLLTETPSHQAVVHAERLRDAVENGGFTVGHEDVRITISVGGGDLPDGSMAPEDVMMDADLAMYEAKDAGRNTVRKFGPNSEHREHVAARMAWSVRISDALQNEKFVLHAQPILDIGSGEVTHFELLIRMRMSMAASSRRPNSSTPPRGSAWRSTSTSGFWVRP